MLILSSIGCSKDSSDETPSTPSYTLTVNQSEGGTVSSSGGSYQRGTEVSLSATPNSEFVFNGWSNGSTENPLSITINTNITLSANFVKRKYPLEINIQGPGTVTEELILSGKNTPTSYNSGSIVRLTAVPTGDWSEFQSWSGDINSFEKTIEITLDDSKEINVSFHETNIIVNENRERIEVEGVTLEDIRATFYDVSGSFHYTFGSSEYFFNGGVYWASEEVSQSNVDPQTLPKIPHLVLKKENNLWSLNQVHKSSATRLVRNPVLYENHMVISCSGEIGTNPDLWRGDAWLGEIVNDDIIWSKINPEGELAFWHGVTAGDLNNDNLIDVGGVPHPDFRLYTQNEDGSFSNQRNLLQYSENNNVPFTLLFVDVDNDGKDEIVTADYGEINPSQSNNVQVYKFNDNSQTFERIFVSNQPEAFYSLTDCPYGLGATSIRPYDFNNDGNIDLSIAREDADCGNAFEIWLGNGSGEFSPHWHSPIWDMNEYQFREFRLLDVNNDDNMDIVLRPNHYGTLYRISPVWWDVISSGGIKLNNSIWLNDGNGNFSSYNNSELVKPGLNVDFLEPFMRDGVLHFIGSFTHPNDSHYGENAITLTISELKVKIE